jgi:hypothetical protein
VTALEDLKPPRRGAKAGYYPDPLGSGRARWWDGAAWTPTVGPPVPADSPPGRPVPPPSKVCKHCGATSETFEPNCPSCGKSYTQNTGLIVAAIATSIAVLLLLAGGCALLVANVADEIGDEFDETAITRAQYDAVAIGTPIGDAKAALGDYFSRDQFRGGECLYYNEEEDLLDAGTYRLCFEGGVLVSKRAREDGFGVD